MIAPGPRARNCTPPLTPMIEAVELKVSAPCWALTAAATPVGAVIEPMAAPRLIVTSPVAPATPPLTLRPVAPPSIVPPAPVRMAIDPVLVTASTSCALDVVPVMAVVMPPPSPKVSRPVSVCAYSPPAAPLMVPPSELTVAVVDAWTDRPVWPEVMVLVPLLTVTAPVLLLAATPA